MSDNISRRDLLAFALVAIAPLQGCLANTSNASLYSESLNVSEADGKYSIEVVPKVGVAGDWDPFRNVTIVAKQKDGETICSQAIGNLTKSGAYEPVTFTCDQFPYEITYDIERDRCGPQTLISKYIYNPGQEYWASKNVECNR